MDKLKNFQLSLDFDAIKASVVRDRRKDKTIEKQALENQRLRRALVREKSNTAIDYLTGLPTKKVIELSLEKVHNRAVRESHNGTDSRYAVIIIDLDNFGLINKKHGQLAGDEVLRKVGKILGNLERDSDYVGRYGGEEFIAILPGCQSVEMAARAAERIRTNLSAVLVDLAHVPTDSDVQALQVTASFGVALNLPSDKTKKLKKPWQATVMQANVALHKAKNNGKNCVHYIEASGDIKGWLGILSKPEQIPAIPPLVIMLHPAKPLPATPHHLEPQPIAPQPKPAMPRRFSYEAA